MTKKGDKKRATAAEELSAEDLDQVVTVSMTSPRVDHRLILMETNGIMITGGVSSLIPADNPEIVETVEIFITNPE